jgi:bifunctional DNase/RNase
LKYGMRWLVQLVLVRVAALFWSLALRIGRNKESSAADAFDASARRALAEARNRTRRTNGDHPEPPPGYVLMSPQAQLAAHFASSLLLVDGDSRTFIPIFVGPTEAAAFQHRLEGKRFPRPLPYDLFDSLSRAVGAFVGSVRIDSIRENVFIATVVLVFDDQRVMELDARASDAIVIAMGAGAPIVVAAEVLEHAGRPLGDLEAQPVEGTP